MSREKRAVLEYALAHPNTNGGQENWLPLAGAMVDVFQHGFTVEEALAGAQERAVGMQGEKADPR